MIKTTMLSLVGKDDGKKMEVNTDCDGTLKDQLQLIALFIVNTCNRNKDITVNDCLCTIGLYAKGLNGNIHHNKESEGE